jgi:hypothetical protein
LTALRGHLSETGIVAPQGAQHAYRLKKMLEFVTCGFTF